ncbi:DUF3102 domain-containing protein [Methylobacterium sp. 174MFSha1.1]|uniref:DUF3102 domain-containing protein n=1 Tax=Methylobacterium sp. 174MFSha1.1 TaxID=1502749 RepID=UPI0015A6B348|nr:DUF3102 domain-containing protein [Methylobacterium sp. 174MFSha1.1]
MSTLPLFQRLSAQPGATVTFDYTQLPEDVASEARQIASRVRYRIRTNIMDTGRDLLEMKQKLGHGAFGPWIAAEFRMTDRTAQNFMRAAEVFSSKPEIVSVLPPTTIYALAAKSTPDDIRADVIARFDEGQPLDARVIGMRINEARRAKREEIDSAARTRERAKLSPEKQAKLNKAEAKKQEAQDAERRRLCEEHERTAKDAAMLLTERLGDDLPRIMELIESVGVYRVREALRALNTPDDGVAGVANAPGAYVPKQQAH